MIISRVEGIHALIKSHIKKSTIDLFEAWRLIKQAVINQVSELKHTRACQCSRTPLDLSNKVFEAVRGLVSYQALRKVKEQLELLSRPSLAPCYGLFTSSYGLPCAHALKRLLEAQENLSLDHFHPHWHLKRSQQLSQKVILQPLQSAEYAKKVSDKIASSTRRMPSGFELVQGIAKAPKRCSACHQIGHTMTQLCCPLRHSNVITLSSSRTAQPSNISPPAPITKIHQSGQSPVQPARLTQAATHKKTQLKNQTIILSDKAAPQIAQLLQESAIDTKAGLDTVPPLDQAGNSPKSSLPVNQQGDLPWRAQDFEQEPVQRHYKALEDEMQAYYSDFVSKHGHLPVGAADRYDKYNLRSRRHRS